MIQRNLIPYHKLLESLDDKIKKGYKKINIYSIFDFNPMVINSYLEYYLSKKKYQPSIFSSEYDQMHQEIISLKKNKKFKSCEILIIGSDINSKLSNNEKELDFYLSSLTECINNALNVSKGKKIFEIIFWNLNSLKSSFYNSKNQISRNEKKISKFNNKLFEMSKKYKNLNILDINKISNYIGVKNLYDDKNYFNSKIPFTEQASDQISYELSHLINTIYQTTKKCLVLDLDNTLWGGIVGEDGIKGIQLGNTYLGEKFKDFQKYVSLLKSRGIILALCSKNNFKDVKECFHRHPEMFLKLNDFSSIKINWKPKYENVNEIASELNIGKDSIVFFDDSQFEREQMKKFNCEVNVIDTPKDVDSYIASIEETGYFNQRFQTKEDKKKLYQYKIIEKANNFKRQQKDLKTFFTKLSMKMEISKINEINFDRSVQMINKTNQFNLTTKRYNPIELKKFLSKKNQISLVAKLKDKFGDHGLTALAMVKQKEGSKNVFILDNFLLSCRILGRNAENVLLNELLIKLKKMKVDYLEAYYIKTNKNEICRNFLNENKFLKIKNKYVFNLRKYSHKPDKYIKVI